MDENSSSKEEERKIRFKRRSVKGRAKLCPRCLSEMHLLGSLSGWMLPAQYECEKCGYHGYVAFESDPEMANQGKE